MSKSSNFEVKKKSKASHLASFLFQNKVSLNLVQPFNILMVRDWKGPADENGNVLNQSKGTQYGRESGYGPSQICTHS